MHVPIRSELVCCGSGARSYSDASTSPDNTCSYTRKAGLEFFILDPSQHFTCYVKAQLNHAISVLMAEAAGLALAAWITSSLQIRDISFLTDSQLLVNFFNASDLSSPPHWDIKPFTQRFLSAVADKNVQVLKIARSFNVTAHSLAAQAFRHPDVQCNPPSITINFANSNHESSCPLRMALQSVTLDPFTLIAASCC